MNELERFHVIRRDELSETNYFTSLVSKAHEKGLFSDSEVEKIQLNALDLLKHRVGIYNGIDSSSVSSEVAENIMHSNLYTLGVFLKGFNVDNTIENIKKMNFIDMYNEGLKILYRKVRVAKSLYFRVSKGKINTGNDVYNATIDGGLRGFFKIYNPEFEADKIKITADYPLYNSLIGKFSGIEFIERYLQALCYENDFCGMFDFGKIEELLYRYSSEYKNLVINIFQLVFTECIGCVLVCKDYKELKINADETYGIYKIFNNKSKNEMRDLVKLAYANISQRLNSKSLREYIEKGLDEVEFIIYNGVRLNKINKVFV